MQSTSTQSALMTSQFVRTLPTPVIPSKGVAKKNILDSILEVFQGLAMVPKPFKVPCRLTPSTPTPPPSPSSPTLSLAASSSASSDLSQRSISAFGSSVSRPVSIPLTAVSQILQPLVPQRAPAIVSLPLVSPRGVAQGQPLRPRDPYAEYEEGGLDEVKVTKILIRLFQHEGNGSLDFAKLPDWLGGAFLDDELIVSSLDLASLALARGDIEALLGYFPDLRGLTINARNLLDADFATLSRFGLLIDLKVVQGDKLTAVVFKKLQLPRLKTLQIEAPEGALISATMPTEETQLAMQTFFHTHENIGEMRVGKYTIATQRVDDETFQEALEGEPERLDIEFEFAAQQLSDSSLHFMSSTLTKLKRIAFVGCRNFTDAGLAALKGLSGLTEVELYGAEQISAAAIADFKAYFEANFVDLSTGESNLVKCIVTKKQVPEMD